MIALRKTLALLTACVLLAATPTTPTRGVFALQGGTEKAEGYLLAPELGSDPLDRHLDAWMTQPRATDAFRQYTVDMTKMLHMIIVSDDLRTFLHVHPILQPDGHFLLNQRLPARGRYYIYADAAPAGIGQQVFRFIVDAGGKADPPRDLSERGLIATAGPYTVQISTNTVASHGESHVIVHIRKNGKPARDLHPYLGALAHCVFLNATDLSYAHVHPMPLSAGNGSMDMGSMDMGSMRMGAMDMQPAADNAVSSPDMLLHVALHEPGTYKLWLEFRGGSQFYVASFVVTAHT